MAGLGGVEWLDRREVEFQLGSRYALFRTVGLILTKDGMLDGMSRGCEKSWSRGAIEM